MIPGGMNTQTYATRKGRKPASGTDAGAGIQLAWVRARESACTQHGQDAIQMDLCILTPEITRRPKLWLVAL